MRQAAEICHFSRKQYLPSDKGFHPYFCLVLKAIWYLHSLCIMYHSPFLPPLLTDIYIQATVHKIFEKKNAQKMVKINYFSVV